MSDFDAYLLRHGEFGVQAMIELWERHQGICNDAAVSLETRWVAFMGMDKPVISTALPLAA